jgi:hypothetical protein
MENRRSIQGHRIVETQIKRKHAGEILAEIVQRLEAFHETHPDFAFTIPSREPSQKSELTKIVSQGCESVT